RNATDEDRERVEGIEVEVRELRLVPLARLFDAYPRAIRDIARETGKRVDLEIAGADVEVDHAVLERVEASLVHLIRNAVDHGVETPAERRAAGKPAEATLWLRATQSGSRVTIVVEDDGRGIDKDSVLATARQRGVIDEGVTAVTLDDAIALLFAPGFTTKSVATETSGRGVGLDMVKADVEGMGGTVRITSEPGVRTRCELSVPVSLVRAPTLVVSVSDNLYGLPPAHAVRVLHPGEGERLDGAYPTLRIGGELVRLVPLSQLLAVGTPPRGEGTVLLLADGDRRLAIEVDRVVSETNVVQREMATLLVASRVTAGTAVIGQGQLVVLLNVAELMRSAHGLERHGPEPRVDEDVPRRQVLVVDDSELTRDILVNLVSRLGYEVIEAVDGQDALRRLGEGPVDLILTDLEMPVLDGFELLDQVRASPHLRELPVVVCSTRGSDEDKRRAADLGADAYVVKSRFDQDELDRTLGRLMGAGVR
ncbi:MAG: response regulator, partial [Polyangiaceae bacterium]